MRKAVFLLFGGNLFSKLLGLVREVLTAGLFGTGAEIGAYRVAQTGMLAPINFFTSDSLNVAFVPQYMRFSRQSRDLAQTLFWSLAVLFGLVSLALWAGLWFMAAPWVVVLAPGLNDGAQTLAVDMLRIMALGIPFYLMSSLLMFLSMANGDFMPMSVRPSVQNLGLIAGALTAYFLKDALFLAWGFTTAYAFYFAWALLRALRLGWLALPYIWLWPNVRAVLAAFWCTLRPLLILPFLLQGNIVVERAVASLIGLAAVSGIDYSRFVTETLIVLLSVPIAFAGLGHWSAMTSQEMTQRLGKVMLLVLLLAVPVSAFMFVNAHVIIEVLYARGAFNEESVQVSGYILMGLAVGLWAQALGYVLIKALNAQQQNGAVLKVVAVGLVANTAFNLSMYSSLGALALGLGSSLGAMVILVGAVVVLGIWREFLAYGWVLALAAIGYLLLAYWLPVLDSKWVHMFFAVTFAVIYWGLWVLFVPLLRRAAWDVIAPVWRRFA